MRALLAVPDWHEACLISRRQQEKREAGMLTRFLMAGLLVLGLSSGARAADRADLQVFREISTQVLRYSYFTIFDSVHAEVDNRIVTLTGKVTMPYKRTDIEKRVATVGGVREIQNRIEVLPVSQMD